MMVRGAQPKRRRVLLLGGGHAHALLIRRFAMQGPSDVQLSVVSNVLLTPYSGMLPGLVAGHYCFEQTHIDLPLLCQRAGVQFIHATATGIDRDAQQVLVTDALSAQPRRLYYDVLSIDTGSTPNSPLTNSTDSAQQQGVGVKPIAEFYAKWQQLLARCQSGEGPSSLALIGGGAAGVEMVLAIAHRLQRLHADSPSLSLPSLALVLRGKEPLSRYPKRVIEQTRQALQRAGVTLYTQFDVQDYQHGVLHAVDGQVCPAEAVFWCTPAKAPDWPARSGLAVDDQGFVSIKPSLQSLSCSRIFAVGDVASWHAGPALPKAGVYAVRQAPVLYDNLMRRLADQPLREYRPQRAVLSILALGEQRAIAVRGGLSVSGSWVWSLKDAIDQRFMHKLQQPLPASMSVKSPQSLLPSSGLMRCSGCGGKLPDQLLQQALSASTSLSTCRSAHPDLLSQAGDDSSALRWPTDRLLVQSIDSFRAPVSDPYVSAQLLAVHALSDVFASASRPHSAQAVVSVHYADAPLQGDELQQVMQGLRHTLDGVACPIIGGHSSEGAELHIGLSVNAESQRWQSQQGAQLGDQLVLTRPLGSGALLAAFHQGQLAGPVLYKLLQNLLHTHEQHSACLQQGRVNGLTDVTGFGLLGHLRQMLETDTESTESTEPRPALAAVIDTARLPVFGGVEGVLRAGITSTLSSANRARVEPAWQLSSRVSPWQQELLLDPQSCGGLLAAIPANELEACLSRFAQSGLSAWVIGRVVQRRQAVFELQ